MRGQGARFYCFSPPVMLATFVIELGLLTYTVLRYRRAFLGRLVAALLLLLALFQLAEWMVCGGANASAAWSRLGFMAITLLPPLGIHLALTIAQRPARLIMALVYPTALAWVVLFAVGDAGLGSPVCAGNYIIFHLKQGIGGAYQLYYYSWLLAGIALCLWFARTGASRRRRALLWQVTGYLLFLVPTTIVNSMRPETARAIPSVMCGFAVLFALILTFKILPEIFRKPPTD